MRVDGRRRDSRDATEVIQERILEAAKEIVRRQGLPALTIAEVARVLHMRATSVERFDPDLKVARRGLTACAQGELVELIAAAVGDQRGRPVLEAMVEFQRLYANAQPGMYEAALIRFPPVRSDGTGAADALTKLEMAVLRACGATEAQAAQLAWCLRAVLSGAIRLEACDQAGRQQQIDENFDRLLGMLEAAVGARPEAAGREAAPAAAESRPLN